jgi:hypothetical protein
MSTSRLLGVMAVLSTAIVTPVTAQPVITEAGYCAQFYPNANCQGKVSRTVLRTRRAMKRTSHRYSCDFRCYGTFETCRPTPSMSVHRGRPEVVGALVETTHTDRRYLRSYPASRIVRSGLLI